MLLAPVFQLYVVAPLAVNVTCAPAQLLGEFTVTVGLFFTRIIFSCATLALPDL